MLHAPTTASTQRASHNSARPAADRQRLGRKPSPVAALQSAYGNQALLRWSSGPANGGVLQRKCACGGTGEWCPECEKKEKSPLQRKAKGAGPAPGVPPVVRQVLASPGKPLDRATRQFMEPRFGCDFSPVRLHAGPHAAESARALNARAYTVGNDIVLGAGEHHAGTVNDNRLLAHELAHVVQQSASPRTASLEVGAANSLAEQEADRAADAVIGGAAPAKIETSAPGIIRRYSHQDCTEDDLKKHIWPADYIARQMTKKAIRVLSASPVDPSVTPLLSKYFMTATPKLGTILTVYDKIDVEYTANDYQYECEDDCGGQELGYVYGLWSDIHLCMNHLRGKPNECIARTMVHEMSHYYAGTDDNKYCKSGCGYDSCPADLKEADAIENADSYACFAYELYPMGV